MNDITPDTTPSDASAPAVCGEDERMSVLAAYSYESLDDDAELTRITRFAARLCNAPIAFVSLVERENQRFLAREGSDLRGTPRELSFCSHTMLATEPMVVTDATLDPRFADNGLVTGEHRIRFYAGAPLISPEGAPLGALCVLDNESRPAGLDAIQREGLQVLAQAVLRRLEARRAGMAASVRHSQSAIVMREIADILPAIIWSADDANNFDYFNSRWRDITGHPAPRNAAEWLPFIHPDDAESALGDWDRSYRAGKPFESEYRLKQADGSWRWVLSRGLSMSSDGQVVRWYGTLTDIDESHRLSESRDILARELSHRIKNIFAVVAGLVSIRARKHEPAKAFAEELVGAIRALGRAHDFVRPMEGVKGDNLRGLLRELMAPYADDSTMQGNGRIRLTGEDCAIGPRAATPLALIFHELATNSAKYGALSVEGGSIEIHIDCPEVDGISRIQWRERGGPAALETGEEGFGTRLVKMSIEGQLGGKIERRFAHDGIEIDLEIPLASIRS